MLRPHIASTPLEPLNLTDLCSVDPSTRRGWRVSNPNNEDVSFTWRGLGSEQTGSLLVGASSTVEFETPTIPGANTLEITWLNGVAEESTTLESSGDICESLLLTPACSDAPEEIRRWSVENPNNFDLDVTWHLVKSDILQTDEVQLPPASTTYVEVPLTNGQNVLQIDWTLLGEGQTVSGRWRGTGHCKGN